MRVTKPIKQSVLHRTYQYRGENHFAVSAFTMFSLSEPAHVLPENDFWKKIADAIGKQEIFDAAMPKPNGEFVVFGSFFAPDNKPAQAGYVSVELGSARKRLNIYGDRHWVSAGMTLGVSEPQPMTEMPLNFANAFGGKDYKENPLGKGIDMVEAEGSKYKPLPNIESPDKLIGSPSDRPKPASMGPIDLTWPQRFKKVGTYDQQWLKNRAPGLADDIDFTHFNATAEDQWVNGFFNGYEHFALRNLHPEHALLEGDLPGLISRCFIVRECCQFRI